MSGDILDINGDQGLSTQGKPILMFSRNFKKEMESLQANNYKLKSSRVNFITYWKKVDSEKEIKIVLPEHLFLKKGEI